MLFLLFHLRFKENSVLLADFDSLWNMSQSEKKNKNRIKLHKTARSEVQCSSLHLCAVPGKL